jgi:transcriptional regulator with XRE-family HTH domain
MFAERLKKLRTESEFTIDGKAKTGLTQKELSEQLKARLGFDLSVSAIQSYEEADPKKRKAPSYLAFKALADFFNVSYDYLFGACDAPQRGDAGASRDLGLSGQALDAIRAMREKNRDWNWDAVNYILTHRAFAELVSCVGQAGFFVRNHRKTKSPIEDMGVIMVGRLETSEMLWAMQNRDTVDVTRLWSNIGNHARDALEKYFGKDAAIISADEAVKYISYNAQAALNRLMEDAKTENA